MPAGHPIPGQAGQTTSPAPPGQRDQLRAQPQQSGDPHAGEQRKALIKTVTDVLRWISEPKGVFEKRLASHAKVVKLILIGSPNGLVQYEQPDAMRQRTEKHAHQRAEPRAHKIAPNR